LPHSLLVTVEDDGKGIAATNGKEAEVRGVGLVSVRERVSRAGGTVNIESAGRGTRLTVELPVRVADSAEENVRDAEPSSMAVSVKS
jgi:signal transduction histidine kinase